MARPEYYSLVKRGVRGPDASLVQTWLNIAHERFGSVAMVNVDGIFGAKSEASAKQYQAIMGLAVDGKVGRNTWESLYTTCSDLRSPAERYPGSYICSGCRGATVRSLQQRLNFLGAALNADGIFGAKTLAAVKMAQTRAGLKADGIVGPKTWAVIYK